MPHINSELLSTRLKLQARQWINDHLNHYFERLQDNFHRRALTVHNSAEQADLLAQHNPVKAEQDEVFRLFSAHITHFSAPSALTELRLQGQRNTHQDISVEPSDDELFQSTANIFHKLSNRCRLTPYVLAALNTMQTQVSSIALRNRSAFIHSLHPARQACRQVFNALAHWDGAESKQR
ncbi:MAG: hypothetical protein ACI9BO_000420 [Zhongshania sp.]|jgi:hypothetical protein